MRDGFRSHEIEEPFLRQKLNPNAPPPFDPTVRPKSRVTAYESSAYLRSASGFPDFTASLTPNTPLGRATTLDMDEEMEIQKAHERLLQFRTAKREREAIRASDKAPITPEEIMMLVQLNNASFTAPLAQPTDALSTAAPVSVPSIPQFGETGSAEQFLTAYRSFAASRFPNSSASMIEILLEQECSDLRNRLGETVARDSQPVPMGATAAVPIPVHSQLPQEGDEIRKVRERVLQIRAMNRERASTTAAATSAVHSVFPDSRVQGLMENLTDARAPAVRTQSAVLPSAVP